MRNEYNSLIKNDTWDLVQLAGKQRVIGCRWVYSLKYKPDQSIEKFKARLVAQGFTQRYGQDYNETFAPVINSVSLRTILALCAEKGLLLHQMDVSTAYLNSELEEEIYMKQPEGFKIPGGKVCRLNKSLYGLKQSGRQWYLKLNETLENNGFKSMKSDRCVYTKDGVLIAVYVDDLLIAANDIKAIREVKQMLASNFDMVDKGDVKNILGLEIERTESSIKVTQRNAILKLLEANGMTECKIIHTPMEINLKFDGNAEPVDKEIYRSIIGSLHHLSTYTRPDITYAVNKLSQYNQDPRVDHLKAAKRILRFLIGTMDKSLNYIRTCEKVCVYADADWASNDLNRKSTTGYAVIMAGAAIAWRSAKQTVTAQSSAEAEYIALAMATNEVLGIAQLLKEIGYLEYAELPIQVFSDSTSAIAIGKNPITNSRTKHIDIKWHVVRERIDQGMVRIDHKGTEEMIADILTKSLAHIKHERFMNDLGLND